MQFAIKSYAWLALIGRILLALLFVQAGWVKAAQPQMTADFMGSAGFPAWWPLAFAVGVFEIVAGLSIALGWKARSSALALALFTLFASLVFHAYWAAPADQQFVQQLLFSKNIAIVGALCFLAAAGAGPRSIDAATKSRLSAVRA
jgi:putative oxidoreductase